MSFLQPAMLIGLPVIALPIIIHLINQRRFQTVQWGAMQFLLSATRMSRGYARIRQWLILAARTLAIAGLVLAISRPLSSGWIGLAAGSRVDTTIILLDRSPSMSERGSTGRSKLDAGIEQLVGSLSLLGSSRYVLIDSVDLKPIEIESPAALLELPQTSAVSSSADLPAMLEVVDQYIRVNRPSRSEVWICSDVRRADWKPQSGRWDAIRSSLLELPQMIRFHLLAYVDAQPQNQSLRVTEVRRVSVPEGAELLLSLRIGQREAPAQPTMLPIQLELDGARSEFTVEISGSEFELRNHVIPLDAGKSRGWGRVSIPSDASPADNEFYFIYDTALPRKTIIVADDPDRARPLEFAAATSPDPEVVCTAEQILPGQLATAAWDNVALVLWQSTLPAAEDPNRTILETLVQRGVQVIFFPPQSPSETSFAGLRWTQWSEHKPLSPSSWMFDQDLLAKTRSGASLPVGQWTVTRHCGLEGERTTLATLDGGDPLLARATTDQRNVYFCTTTASPDDSSLGQDGVVLYAMIHRGLDAGAAVLGNTRQAIAGEINFGGDATWRRLAGNPDALSSEFSQHAGVYQSDQQLVAINRSESEDISEIVPAEEVARLFGGLDFDRVDERAESGSSLIQEIWRLFLLLMLLALLIEAVLCLPRRPLANPAARGVPA